MRALWKGPHTAALAEALADQAQLSGMPLSGVPSPPGELPSIMLVL
jgi:hypothetical protein